MDNKETQLILWFDQLSIEDVPLVGGKNASLGEMYKNLTIKGVSIPNGFAVTATAYRYFLEKAGLKDKIKEILSDLNTSDIQNLQERGEKVRSAILNTEFPDDLKASIIDAYGHMCIQYGKNTDVAVRSSATAEDLPDASFAGQQDTYLNIKGPLQLIEASKRCIASLFTDRAISYRVDKGFDHFSIALSIGVQKMVRSDKGSAGVMFSIDTESGFKDVVFLTAAYGLGENVVQGAVNPDEYYIFKPTLNEGKRPIISKTLGSKELKMIYSLDGTKPVKNIPTTKEEQSVYALTDDEILTLAKWAVIIEDHYSTRAGYHKPMDMEWAKDGISGELFIVQARPETVQSRKNANVLEEYILNEKSKVLIEGGSVGAKIGTGNVNVIKDVHEIKDFKKGQVLVTDMTDPDWEPIMKIASAIVTNRGGRTCHAAIISRELGIPCVVGCKTATEELKNGQIITVSCADGETGKIYAGELKFEIKKTDLTSIPQTKTKIMMNIGTPSQAFEQSFTPNDGVGLAREEFIINSYIRIHPLALLKYEELKKDSSHMGLIHKIDELTSTHTNKTQFYIDKLAEGIGTIAAAFYPKDVIVRLSDFKSNEYVNLIGGNLYEPTEDNPMIGFRGASRYYSEMYKDAFILECKALTKVRNDFGLTNVKIMVPFCRTVEEGKKVRDIMSENGLIQGENGLQLYVMAEIPANVILVDQFADIFDGFSIGTNDLTQLALGVDRDSELVAHVYDERNEAVKRLVKQVVDGAKAKGRKIGICGQAPSDYPEFAQFLVE
ncbi:phosphoenolpyruvate synthase, partial [archaeon]|nr:phosphoenolpyruvate synthase [archaeon]